MRYASFNIITITPDSGQSIAKRVYALFFARSGKSFSKNRINTPSIFEPSFFFGQYLALIVEHCNCFLIINKLNEKGV